MSRSTQKVRSELFKSPFPHMIVHNFLSNELYAKTLKIYNKLQFKEKSSDLFHFFQTYELNQSAQLKYFQKELDSQFQNLPTISSSTTKKNVKEQNRFYSIFASYYFQGDYLLCHDDVIQDRVYAFSYYLEDHDSADLVFFKDDAKTQAKRIKVKKNTLAIFQVSNVSYHEVDICKKDGRKAITGWFNIKGYGKLRDQKTIAPYVPSLPVDPIQYPLPEHYLTEEFFQLIDIEYQFNEKKCKLQGPLFSRRVHKIQIRPCVAFQLPGYKLLSAQFYSFKEGDYILLNDPVNNIEGQTSFVDIFVTNLPQDFEMSVPDENQEDDQTDQGNVLVKIVQEDEEPSGIPQIHDSLFIVQRGRKQYYVERVVQGKEFRLAHFIYAPDFTAKDKKQTKKQISAKADKTQTKKSSTNKIKAKTVAKTRKIQKKGRVAKKSLKKKSNPKLKTAQQSIKKQSQPKSSTTRRNKK